MLNHHQTQPRPASACAAVAPLLAQVVAQKRLPPQAASALQAHLETCAQCRYELDSYHWLDDLLARHFAPPARNPLSPDEISAIIRQPARPRAGSPALPARSASPGSRRPSHLRRRALDGAGRRPSRSRWSLARPLPEPAPRARRRYGLISAISALAAVVLIAVISVAVLKSHAPTPPGAGQHPSSTPGSTALSSPTPGITALPQPIAYTPTFGDTLNSISMVSASDGWAVGGGSVDPLILHYTGGQWERITNPTGGALPHGEATLAQVVMVSATEGWAVGSYTDFSNNLFGLILHYTGGIWTVQKTLSGDQLNGLAMLSASDGWAVGDTPSQASVLLHYSGGVWASVPLAGNSLNHIVMTSPTDGWIVEQPQFDGPVWHYNGNTWTSQSIPGIYSVGLISMTSPTDGWAVGLKLPSSGAKDAFSAYGGDTAFAHYNGKTWTAIQTFTQPMNVTGLSLDSSNDGWAVGTVVTPNGQPVVNSTNLVLHYTGGRWTQVNGQQAVMSDAPTVSMVSASDGWIVDVNGAILRYHQGAWTVVAPAAQK